MCQPYIVLRPTVRTRPVADRFHFDDQTVCSAGRAKAAEQVTRD